MRICVLGGLFTFLAGCALLEPAVDQVLEVDRLGGEAITASRAPAAEQKVALTRAQQAFAADGRPMNRLRYATLLATLPAPLRDDARAAELLEPIADSNALGIGRFAALLAGQLAERQRLARELERVARESERAAREREKLERERAATDKERDKREEALRQQLEALRAIERGILEREENLRRRQR
jgi:hypothetical protein